MPLSDAFALYEQLGDPRRLVVLLRFGHAEASFRAGFVAAFEVVLRDVLRSAPTEPLGRSFVCLVDR